MSTGAVLVILLCVCSSVIAAASVNFVSDMNASSIILEDEPDDVDPLSVVLPSGLKACEVKGDWKLTGECEYNGMGEHTQTIIDNSGDGTGCPEGIDKKMMKCCYEKGNWLDMSFCIGGKKQQKQTIVNCPSDKNTREVECTKETKCGSNGKRLRTTNDLNGNEVATEEDCCYMSEWRNVGGCKARGGKQTQERDTINCKSYISKTQEVDCCYIGEWEDSGACQDDGKMKQTRTIYNCPTEGVTERTVDCLYTFKKSFETPYSPNGGTKQYGNVHDISCDKDDHNGALMSFKFAKNEDDKIRNEYGCYMSSTQFKGKKQKETPHGASGSQSSGRNAMWDVASHPVDCGNNFITGWKLHQWSNSMKMVYSCSDIATPDAGKCEELMSDHFGEPQYAGEWTKAGTISCPKDKLLTRWNYNRSEGRIKYRCCPKP
jgi:hypothetical protein